MATRGKGESLLLPIEIAPDKSLLRTVDEEMQAVVGRFRRGLPPKSDCARPIDSRFQNTARAGPGNGRAPSGIHTIVRHRGLTEPLPIPGHITGSPDQRSADSVERFRQRNGVGCARLADGDELAGNADVAAAPAGRRVLRHGKSHLAASGIGQTRRDGYPGVGVKDVPLATRRGVNEDGVTEWRIGTRPNTVRRNRIEAIRGRGVDARLVDTENLVGNLNDAAAVIVCGIGRDNVSHAAIPCSA